MAFMAKQRNASLAEIKMMIKLNNDYGRKIFQSIAYSVFETLSRFTLIK
jgi:hypothetical protein